MNAGVTWLSRALNRPPKSVKYLEAVSSTVFNLVSPLSESAHVENKLAEARIVHKPFASSVNDTSHLFIMPLRYFVSDEQGFVVAKDFGNAITCHSTKCLHNKLLDVVWNRLVF